MKKSLSIVALVLVWVVSFVEPSGWGEMMHLSDKCNWLIAIIATLMYLIGHPFNRLPIKQTFFMAIVVLFAIIPYIVSDSSEGASYLVGFLATYIISQCKVEGFVIKYSAIIIALLGGYVLYVYISTDILSGWNDNAISITGMLSYLYFTIFLVTQKNGRNFWIWNIVTVLFIGMLSMTECRSALLFSVIAFLCILFSNRTKGILSNKKFQLLILNFPLLLSIIVIMISQTALHEQLEIWSIQNNGKGIFDGRDELWTKAYELLADSYYLGTGVFKINYHNSGVAAISVFGILGYICWIKFFSRMLTFMDPYIGDDIVFGCMVAFITIYIQQSFDLGLICPVPNLIPYAILGLGIGRVQLLRSHGKG